MKLNPVQVKFKMSEFQSGQKQILEPGKPTEKFGTAPDKIAPKHAMMMQSRFTL